MLCLLLFAVGTVSALTAFDSGCIGVCAEGVQKFGRVTPLSTGARAVGGTRLPVCRCSVRSRAVAGARHSRVGLRADRAARIWMPWRSPIRMVSVGTRRRQVLGCRAKGGSHASECWSRRTRCSGRLRPICRRRTCRQMLYPLVRELAVTDAPARMPVGVTCRVLGLARQPDYR